MIANENFPNVNPFKKSDFNISFMVDIGVKQWYLGQEKQGSNFLNESLKSKIPKNKMFNINSLFFNFAKHRREILSKFECYYEEESNSLSIIFTKEFEYAYFTKETMLNLLEFVLKVNIDTIFIMINFKNKKFRKILQDMIIVGFKKNEANEATDIAGEKYQVMSMDTDSLNDDIEEIEF